MKLFYIKEELSRISGLSLKYPLLEQLDWKMHVDYEENANNFEELIKLNSQIRRLSIYRPTMRLMRSISQNLPNLEHLELIISQRLFPAEVVNFKSIRNLTVTCEDSHFPETVSFEQLKELQFRNTPHDFDVWLEFIRRHSSLTKLILTNSEMNAAFLNQISNVPQLNQVVLRVPSNISAESIVAFLNNKGNIMKLELLMTENANEFGRILHYTSLHLPKREWNISHSQSGFLFLKKPIVVKATMNL